MGETKGPDSKPGSWDHFIEHYGPWCAVAAFLLFIFGPIYVESRDKARDARAGYSWADRSRRSFDDCIGLPRVDMQEGCLRRIEEGYQASPHL